MKIARPQTSLGFIKMQIGIGVGMSYGGKVADFLPSSIASLWGWYDASDLSTLFQNTGGSTPVSAADQAIGRIADKSGKGHHLTMGTAGATPTYKTGIQNSKPALLFDGGDRLDSAATLDSFPVTILGVAKRTSTIGATQGLVSLYHSTNLGSRITLTSGNVLQALVAGEQVSTNASGTIGADTSFLFGARLDNDSIDVIKNGTISGTAHAAVAVSNILSLGRTSVNSGTNLLNGYLCEVLVFNAFLTNLQIADCTLYLNTKWAAY
jgi:hypothetical protein